ncbi:MAG: type II toxin-antitoxin system VapC family toxin [Vicinamibacterales bacterium]|jgi:PIN domain nuclease of toxin-antitoxin system|nr:PIN domain nuclease [Acidobacteriota bacterium]MDP7294816.1 type II toxin-antitoxin system VapC family toxin [Vicinamibacterales bacterium]MDP7473070.1 type II toxin-antitoxin system VapC family toxin [Vicinamibacterales bacterium]MDP7670895.1 type II toxin-antitoxin system VapC family toxin [Vicinamibacterales bacterium]HJO39640.1 type II toxin-antitoxin system VapC family toxin [Vicinamibacterales bacterium]|tara:strand:- start:250 stop:642 length:393 start_codon:yes stop_codon:yes gene_type:complete
MNLLLDTTPFLWYITGSAVLPEQVVDAIRTPANDVALSVVSLREILLKHRLGRLDLPEEPGAYIPRQRERHQIAPLGLEEGTLTHLSKLPPHHGDPFDRLLIAQAIEHDLTIVTPDENIQKYPVKTFWAA